MRWFKRDFLPPTAGRSLIGGTSACSGPLLRVTALLSGLRAGDCSLPLLRMGHAQVWVVACPPLLRERLAATTLIPLMPCALAGISFWSILASSRLSVSEVLFYVCRDTLFQDTFWGVSDFLVLYHSYLYFCIFSMWILICWCEENTGRHFKGFFIYQKYLGMQNNKQGG